MAAHPRRRGEHPMLDIAEGESTGSSPQARGARSTVFAGSIRHGLIPAGAGSTWTSTGRRCGTPAHPRRRGEHIPHRALQRGEVRLIPAGAGSTATPPPRTAPEPAHPRRRGEHAWAVQGCCVRRGSSPQARGALEQPREHRAEDGLIPAGAGSTASARMTRSWRAAHPRRRGEHGGAPGVARVGDGSSPQARGAHGPVGEVRGGLGLIPAGAGSTNCSSWLTTGPLAHPRRRGEHGNIEVYPGPRGGSSPQARGAPVNATFSDWVKGLIPAGAGSTTSLLVLMRSTAAHPRRRGEHLVVGLGGGLLAGSSPQARGAPLLDRDWHLHARLIPAGAGSTRASTTGRSGLGAHPRRRGEHFNGMPMSSRDMGSSPQARGARRDT